MLIYLIYHMNLFDRYLLINYLKIFFTVSLVSVGLVALYSLTDFLLGFKDKNLKVGVSYLLYLIPIGFYILSSLLVNISLLIFMRRILSRKMDLTVQSFGVSPLRFSLSVLFFTLFLSGTLLALNESFIPQLFKKIWYIEKTFKKKQEIGRIVERLWFVKKSGRDKYYVYVGSLDVVSGRFADFFLLKVFNSGVGEIIEGRSGWWKGRKIEIDEGSAYDFHRGYFEKNLKEFSLEVEIDLSEVSLFAEKIAHVSTSSLLNLYLKGSKLGFDTDRYLSEVMYRAGMSFLPLIVLIPLLNHLFKYRSLRVGMLSFFLHLLVGWLVIISPKLLAEKAGMPANYALAGFLLLGIYLLKRIYDLGKGFRV